MLRESKPTLTPRHALNESESRALSDFLFVAEQNPALALASISGYRTASQLTSEAEQVAADPDAPAGHILAAVAGLVKSEVIFVLEPDDETKVAIENQKSKDEVSYLTKVKGYLGELANHKMFLDRVSLAAIALEAQARNTGPDDGLDLIVRVDTTDTSFQSDLDPA